MHIKTKKQMYELLRAGAFGNTARSWSSYAELLESGYRGFLGIRSLIPGGPFLAHVPFLEAPNGNFMYSEMQDDEAILLQGEVVRIVDGLYLWASRLKTHMRPALKEGGKAYSRLVATYMLYEYLWPSDYDALMLLLDTYPDSVVEFSAYNKAVGILPQRNTIIWEVRNY